MEGFFALCEYEGRVLEEAHEEGPQGSAVITFDLFHGIFVAGQRELVDAVLFSDFLEGGVAKNGVRKPEHPAVWQGEGIRLGDEIKRGVIIIAEGSEADNRRGGGPAQSRLAMDKDRTILDVATFRGVNLFKEFDDGFNVGGLGSQALPVFRSQDFDIIQVMEAQLKQLLTGMRQHLGGDLGVGIWQADDVRNGHRTVAWQ